MVYEVALTKDAERDLEDIYRYMADSPASADHVPSASFKRPTASDRPLVVALLRRSFVLSESRSTARCSSSPID